MKANQQYKKYRAEGGTLSFAAYMTREKAKGFLNVNGSVSVPQNKPLTDSIQKTIDEMRRSAGYKSEAENKYILGINKNALIVVGFAGLVITSVVLYKKFKK